MNVQPLPVYLSHQLEPIQGKSFCSEATVAITIYDFGAVSLDYRIPFCATLEQLAHISSELYDSAQFAADARSRAGTLLQAIEPAVRAPNLRDRDEDYLVFTIPQWPDPHGPLDRSITQHQAALAGVLSSNTQPLSVQQQREELAAQVSYYEDDLTIVTWNAALVVGHNMEDVLTVLELANVQLRELNYMDYQLDRSLETSYDDSSRAVSVKTQMTRIREFMLDGQAFSEAVTNAFKPFPDAFLARVYVMASRSLGLNQFNQSIRDKLQLLNTLYTTLSDEAAHRRSARLEWIVIILIFIEIVMGLSERLLPWWGH